MYPLSGIDATFLAVETRKSPMNVVGTLTLEPSAKCASCNHATILERVRRRLPGIAPLRRRLRSVPLGLGNPVWEDVENLDAGDHVLLWRAAAPGSTRTLADFVARVAERRLDRTRPLWELWVVEGLRGGRVGLVFVLHHAVADGISAAAILLQLLGASPGDSPPPIPLPVPPRRAPTPAALTRRALGELAQRPRRVTSLLAQTARAAAALRHSGLGASSLPFGAPPTPWNRSLSKRRCVSYSQVHLDDVALVRETFGCTLNDVVLAACTRSLRHHLAAQGALPTEPLVAAIPVSVRSAAGQGGGNQISAMFSRLPVHVSDPVEQLLEVHHDTSRAKRAHRLLGGETLGAWAELGSAALIAGASQLYSALGLADRHRPLYNLVISNVPGPTTPLQIAGMQVESARPHGPLMDGVGLNITVLRYADALHFGVLACREAVPEPWSLAFGFGAGVGDLVKAALRERGEGIERPGR